ncbi:hypothetical protein Dimus_023861 [Dionaea muscipula]
MEEEKAVAYYDELTRKGGAAARFKQGLGFSASSPASGGDPPSRGSALPSSSFLGNFVRASSPTKLGDLHKQAQLEKIQNKLKKKVNEPVREKDNGGERARERSSRRRSWSKERGRERERNSRRSRSRSRSRSRGRETDKERKGRGRNRSRSVSKEERRPSRRPYRSRSRDGERDDRRRRRSLPSDEERKHRMEKGRGRTSRSRSLSPRDRRLEKGRADRGRVVKIGKKEKNAAIDYARLIEGYDKMTPAERVKAKMKFQLSETAQKDSTVGSGSGWERFEFDKDAPLDDDEIEVADDDAAVVKRIGQSFRFSTIEVKREEEIKAAHDAAMFGAPALPPAAVTSESEQDSENERKESDANNFATHLMSDKVLAKQQGSWRDRARKSAP